MFGDIHIFHLTYFLFLTHFKNLFHKRKPIYCPSKFPTFNQYPKIKNTDNSYLKNKRNSHFFITYSNCSQVL